MERTGGFGAVIGALARGAWQAAAGGPDRPPSLLPGRLPRLRAVAPIACVLAAFVLAMVGFGNAAAGRGPQVQVLWVLCAAPVALMPYRPLLAWRVAWLLGAVSLLVVPAEVGPIHWYPGQVLATIAVLFVVGAAQPGPVLVWVWVATVPVAWAGVDEQGRAGVTLLVTGVLLGGALVRLRAQARRRLAAAEERGAVLTERARIARELHDVVAHHMSMIAVRTETAPYRLGDLPEPARDEFAEISRASREALTEMRRLLGVLRSEDPAPVEPQPGLADLSGLVEAARAAGAEVSAEVDSGIAGVPAAVELTAYRIVQEALTNAARHAPGAPVRVEVARLDGGLSVAVRNGPGGPAPAGTGPGHGVRGMRERAAMLGGELRVGPDDHGGFEVTARLPLAGAA